MVIVTMITKRTALKLNTIITTIVTTTTATTTTAMTTIISIAWGINSP